MTSVCILTDSTAQFTRPDFPGHDLVRAIAFDFHPVLPRDGQPPFERLTHPGIADFLKCYTVLNQDFDAILTITVSASLSPAAHNAQKAAALHSGHALIEVIDSHTTAIGLGLLVQIAAEAAGRGLSLNDVERLVRAAASRVYTLFCVPGLTYLAQAGYLSPAQATVGEMMGLLPIFAIEDGHLTPMQKVRTQRHLIESFQEFLDEFNDPSYVAVVKGHSQSLRTRPLREYVAESFPNTPFSEHPMNRYLSALVGSQSIGLVVMERVNVRAHEN